MRELNCWTFINLFQNLANDLSRKDFMYTETSGSRNHVA